MGLRKSAFTSLDRVVKPISDMLTFGKFFTVFSFLFGLSFAIQLANAARKGGNLTPRFLWRITILFGIGFVHSLFFTGDILIIYAVLGFFLVPCQKLSNRVLLIAGTLLVLNAPLFLGRLLVLNAPPPSRVEMEQRKQQEQSLQNQATEQFEVKHSGSLSDVIRLNLTSGFVGKLIFQLISGRLFISFGLFLLGVVAGRAQLFSNTPRNVRFFRGTLLVSGVIALVSTPIA
jgi:uncharacterized protein